MLSLENISKGGKCIFRGQVPNPSIWRKATCSLRSVCKAPPCVSGSRQIRLLLASRPPCLSPLHPGWGLCHPWRRPPQQGRCIQRRSEAIWQKEKGAIVCLQSESHNLFFLKHLHSRPHLPVATEDWGIHALRLDDGREPRKISRAAGAPFLLKKKRVWPWREKNLIKMENRNTAWSFLFQLQILYTSSPQDKEVEES